MNKDHGCEEESDKECDNMLQVRIDCYNSLQMELNGHRSGPKFSLDILKNTKTKHGKRSKYLYNFKKLYLDGIHPSELLSRLWLIRIRKFILSTIGE